MISVRGSRKIKTCILFLSFVGAGIFVHAEPLQKGNADTLRLGLEPQATFQTIDNFGASDAWSCQFAGLWDQETKNKIADLLFSQDLDKEGNPAGIGLSAWRFNIGAGSAGQGEQSGIRDPWRRAESFMQKSGRYDFNKAAGQRWFLEAARKRGVKDFIGFCNSAPYWMTKNGKTYSTAGQTNLSETQYDAFAAYLVNIIKGLKTKTGILLNYISPVNEPQWDWSDGGQEGSPYRNNEIAALSRVLDRHLNAAKLPTKISVAEAGQIDYLYTGSDKPQRGSQIQTFFGKEAAASVLGLSHVDHSIAGHSYFTTSPFAAGVEKRTQLSRQISRARKASGLKDLRYWMSEYCILGDNHGEIDGNHRDLGMSPALYLARVIHMDLCYADASAWQWWLALSAYDYKDGLIYIDKTSVTGHFYESKMLWTLGNYSRFIRPGYIRIGNTVADEGMKDTDVLVSTFKDPSGKKIVIVVVNEGGSAQVIQEEGPVSAYRIKDAYITSEKYNLRHFTVNAPGAVSVILPPRSVVTLTGDLD